MEYVTLYGTEVMNADLNVQGVEEYYEQQKGTYQYLFIDWNWKFGLLARRGEEVVHHIR